MWSPEVSVTCLSVDGTEMGVTTVLTGTGIPQHVNVKDKAINSACANVKS